MFTTAMNEINRRKAMATANADNRDFEFMRAFEPQDTYSRNPQDPLDAKESMFMMFSRRRNRTSGAIWSHTPL